MTQTQYTRKAFQYELKFLLKKRLFFLKAHNQDWQILFWKEKNMFKNQLLHLLLSNWKLFKLNLISTSMFFNISWTINKIFHHYTILTKNARFQGPHLICLNKIQCNGYSKPNYQYQYNWDRRGSTVGSALGSSPRYGESRTLRQQVKIIIWFKVPFQSNILMFRIFFNLLGTFEATLFGYFCIPPFALKDPTQLSGYHLHFYIWSWKEF